MYTGYKLLNSNWTDSHGISYEIGRTYESNNLVLTLDNGIIFFDKAAYCLICRDLSQPLVIVSVNVLGDVVGEAGLFITNRIKIIHEISYDELVEYADLEWVGNTAKHNLGYSNNGNYNIGDQNYGYENLGSKNYGEFNNGSANVGLSNIGNGNYGSHNIGDGNLGQLNVGSYNASDNTVGWFNTKSQYMMFFDKPIKMSYEEWINTEAYEILSRIDAEQTVWVEDYDMTSEDELIYPHFSVTCGCLKKAHRPYFKIWWKNLSKREKRVVKDIPNFNRKKFRSLTGIKL